MCRGLKIIGLLVCLCLLSGSLFADVCLSDSAFLRLRILLTSSLGISETQLTWLASSTETLQDLKTQIESSSLTIKSLSGTILNLQSLLKQSEETSKKLSASLEQQTINSFWIAGGCIAGGVIIGFLIRNAFK